MLHLPHTLVLASASPQRKKLLEIIGVDFEIIPSRFQEPLHSDVLCDPRRFAVDLALGKGQEVFDRMEKKKIVLSADSIGILGDLVLEKPRDRDHAKQMISQLAGKTHVVLTAVALFHPDREVQVRSVETKVSFKPISDAELESYLDAGEYVDKAASYAIQGKASLFVERIEGDFYNIVGLPVSTIYDLLKTA
ncbi:MAG: Maf family protein [bacterium]|nr:Maf family protein [bacterium]